MRKLTRGIALLLILSMIWAPHPHRGLAEKEAAENEIAAQSVSAEPDEASSEEIAASESGDSIDSGDPFALLTGSEIVLITEALPEEMEQLSIPEEAEDAPVTEASPLTSDPDASGTDGGEEQTEVDPPEEVPEENPTDTQSETLASAAEDAAIVPQTENPAPEGIESSEPTEIPPEGDGGQLPEALPSDGALAPESPEAAAELPEVPVIPNTSEADPEAAENPETEHASEEEIPASKNPEPEFTSEEEAPAAEEAVLAVPAAESPKTDVPSEEETPAAEDAALAVPAAESPETEPTSEGDMPAEEDAVPAIPAAESPETEPTSEGDIPAEEDAVPAIPAAESPETEPTSEGDMPAEEDAVPAIPAAENPEAPSLPEEEIHTAGEETLPFLTSGNREAGLESGPEGEGSGPAPSLPELTGASSGQIPISSLTLSRVPTNPGYSQLSFLFQDSSAGKDYKCLISGMRVSQNNRLTDYQKLAQEIALYFLSGQSLRLTNEGLASRFGLDIDLIDAEKQSVLSGDDTKMCWAASAANMIEYAGWNVSSSEDAAYADISGSFNNLGGTQQMAISWYMNGVNPGQLVNSSGKVLYSDTSTGAAQQKAAGSGGYHTGYSAAAAAPDTGSFQDVRNQLEAGADGLGNGSALGIGVYTYKKGTYQGEGHSLTVFGYVGEWISQALGRLSALFVADSDSDAAGQTTAPEERVNAYTMYHLSDYSSEDLETVALKGYKNAKDTDVLIGTVTSLAPPASVPKEKDGTGDARRSVNLVPEDLWIKNESGKEISEASAGDTLYLPLEINNTSYAGLPADAVLEITLHSQWNGISLRDQKIQVGADFLQPLAGGIATLPFDALAPGEYQFQAEITGIADPSGNRIREAYTSDNLLKKMPTITVREAKAATGTVPEETIVETSSGDGAPRAITGSAARICRTIVSIGNESTYEVEFSASGIANQASGKLMKMKTNEIVNPRCYEILLKNGKYQIRFAELFLRMLKPGNNDFQLVFDNRVIVIRLVIQ